MAKLSVFTVPSALYTSPAVVMRADFTAIGDQAGYLPISSVAMPARFGEALDVPDIRPNVLPW